MYKIVISYLVGYKYQTSSITFEIGSPKVVTLGQQQQYNASEKPTVTLEQYTYINRNARPPNYSKQITVQYIIKQVVITYDKNYIEPCDNRG